MSDVTKLQEVKQQREAKAMLDRHVKAAESLAKEHVGKALQTDMPDRLTDALSALLLYAKSIVFHKGGDLATQGKMKICAADQVENAAKNQTYHIHEEPSLNTVRLSFDDNYYYDVILSDDVSTQQRHNMICALAEEAINNVFIDHLRNETMGFSGAQPPDWLAGPLKTGALRVLLNISESCELARWDNENLSGSKVSPDSLVDYASKTLFNIYAQQHANKVVLSFSDQTMTKFIITVPPYLPKETFDEVVGNVCRESGDNHNTAKESRPSDPDAASRRAAADAFLAAMLNADPELDEFVKQHGRTPEIPNRDLPDNVTPMRRR